MSKKRKPRGAFFFAHSFSSQSRLITALPPIRTVAQELSVSLISVRRAWEELERDGFIHTAVGRGTFAAALGETDKAAMRRAILKEKLTDAAQFCAAVGASGEEAAALLREIGICPHFDLIRDHF